METDSDSMPAELSPNVSGLPAPVGQSVERQTFVSRDELIDHPDWELYYSSGVLTLPLCTTLLGIVIPIGLFMTYSAAGLSARLRTQWLQLTFHPWGEVLLVLIFCTWASILFSLLLSEARVVSRARWCVVGGLRVFVFILLSASPTWHFWCYRYSYASADIGAAGALYFICTMFHEAGGLSSV